MLTSRLEHEGLRAQLLDSLGIELTYLTITDDEYGHEAAGDTADLVIEAMLKPLDAVLASGGVEDDAAARVVEEATDDLGLDGLRDALIGFGYGDRIVRLPITKMAEAMQAMIVQEVAPSVGRLLESWAAQGAFGADERARQQARRDRRHVRQNLPSWQQRSA